MRPPISGSSWPWAKCLFHHHRELQGRDETAFPPSPGSQLGCSLFFPITDQGMPWASSPDFPPGNALMIEMWSSTTSRELGANTVWPWANQVKPHRFSTRKHSTSLGWFWGAPARNPRKKRAKCEEILLHCLTKDTNTKRIHTAHQKHLESF